MPCRGDALEGGKIIPERGHKGLENKTQTPKNKNEKKKEILWVWSLVEKNTPSKRGIEGVPAHRVRRGAIANYRIQGGEGGVKTFPERGSGDNKIPRDALCRMRKNVRRRVHIREF